MFKIRFYNELGEVIFGGGNSVSNFRITAADGLVFAEKNFSVIKYANQDGQETNSALDKARTITLSGDMLIDSNFGKGYSRALATLSKEGVLEITTALGTRVISGRCCDFREVDRNTKYLIFTVQFICDCPYFEDPVKTEVGIFGLIPHLDKHFSFPGSFSTRISKTKINYAGTVKTEPVFIVNINEGSGGNNVLSMYNHTSGESLKFNYSANLGDSITIDVKNRKIYNSNGENLLNYLSDESFFDGFYLYPGINDIEVLNGNMNAGVDVSCRYTNRFSEAVII